MTEESNKIIAEFMGGEYVEEKKEIYSKETHWIWKNVRPLIDLEVYSGLDAPTELLKYHASWDWLMPVVEKIESDLSIVVAIMGVCCEVDAGDTGKVRGDSKREATYQAVVEAIKWHNKNKK